MAMDSEGYVSSHLGWVHGSRLQGVCLQGCTCAVCVSDPG